MAILPDATGDVKFAEDKGEHQRGQPEGDQSPSEIDKSPPWVYTLICTFPNKKRPQRWLGHRPRAGLHADRGGAEVAHSIPQEAAPVKSRRGRFCFCARTTLPWKGVTPDSVGIRDAGSAQSRNVICSTSSPPYNRDLPPSPDRAPNDRVDSGKPQPPLSRSASEHRSRAGPPGLHPPVDRAGGPSSQEFRKVSENSEQLCGILSVRTGHEAGWTVSVLRARAIPQKVDQWSAKPSLPLPFSPSWP